MSDTKTFKSLKSGIDVDDYLAIPPEEALENLKTKEKDSLILFKEDIKTMYNDTYTVLKLGKKQLNAVQNEPKLFDEINKEVFVLATLAQKLEDLNTMIDALLKG